MAYSSPKVLDEFLPHLSKMDTRHRLQVGADLLAFLGDPSNSITCQDIGQLIDGLIPWMQSSNYKVSSNGIEVMTNLIDRLGPDFRPYLQVVLPNVIDRLGDTKDTVREKAQLVILKLLERNTLPAQVLFEKLSVGFNHKNAKIREEVLRCLVNTINEHGAHSLTLNKFIPDIVKLLSDPTVSVRDTAVGTLVDLYRHVGDKLRMDLQRRNLIPASKWPMLVARFDEVKNNGELLPSATKSIDYNDEVDRVTLKPVVPFKKPNLGSTAVKARGIVNANPAPCAGAVDEETFLKSFEDVPTVQIFAPRDITEHLNNIGDIISDPNKDWNRRTDALKKIRSLIIAEATVHDEFHTGIKQLEFHLQSIIKDLRSQVVREGCITIAYLAQTLGGKFEKSAERLLPSLINLIQNSAKIVSTSGLVTIRFIIQNIYGTRLIPIIAQNAATSKSKEIRKSCCEFLDCILNNWPRHALERHMNTLQEALKKGITDADPEARVSSRKAFRGFREHFPDQAEVLLQSLDASYRRALQGDGMSASSSNSNLSTGYRTLRPYGGRTVTTSHSATGSFENLSTTSGGDKIGGALRRAPSLPRTYRQRSGIPVLTAPSRDTSSNNGKRGVRSNSAIDLQAAQRAKARTQYAALARTKVNCGTSTIPRNRKIEPITPAAAQSPERLARTRSRNSQSQPTSRSGSPSSRLAYLYHKNTSDYYDSSPVSGGSGRRLRSSIPRSSATSRETSPNRSTGTLGRLRRSTDRPPLNPARPLLAQKMLQQSREAESAFAERFVDDESPNQFEQYRSPRRSHKGLDSDESETSSVCSERSMESLRRTSDSYSWNGSQQRLYSKDLWEPCCDIREIISLCASTNWQERKDGLLSLQFYMNSGELLMSTELEHLTKIFTKMFMDPHTKGLSIFLDTLMEVLKLYRSDLHDWLYVLLQRIFTKLGADTLYSVHTKLLATLEIIRQHYPLQLVVMNVYRFLVDATQTPNYKVKITVMQYLTMVFSTPDASSNFVSSAQALHAIQKILGYCHDVKSTDLRSSARQCIVAMWNCNTPQMTRLLAELPKDQQDIASNIVHQHMRRSSTSSANDTTLDTNNSSTTSTNPLNLLNMGHFVSPTSATPSPQHHLNNNTNKTNNNHMDHDEIYRSLKKTSAEIQNYSFETFVASSTNSSSNNNNNNNNRKTDRDTTSQDSGISQMSLGTITTITNSNNYQNNHNHHHHHHAAIGGGGVNLEDMLENMNLVQSSSRSGPKSLPPYINVNGVVGAALGTTPRRHSNETGAAGGGDSSNGYRSLGDLRDPAVMKHILEKYLACTEPTSPQDKQQILFQLIDMIKQGHVESIIPNFKRLLRIIIEYIQASDSTNQIAGLDVLTAIFQREELKSCWEDFVELLTLTVLRALSDEQREVVKVAEATTTAMHVFFPFDSIVTTLTTLIKTGHYPDVLGPIKMLTKVIEAKPNEMTDHHLATIMPGLIQCTDHVESMVRKNAIFCMVAVHGSVGEDRLRPYLEKMPASKVKLLRLYVSRSAPVFSPQPSSPNNNGSNYS